MSRTVLSCFSWGLKAGFVCTIWGCALGGCRRPRACHVLGSVPLLFRCCTTGADMLKSRLDSCIDRQATISDVCKTPKKKDEMFQGTSHSFSDPTGVQHFEMCLCRAILLFHIQSMYEYPLHAWQGKSQSSSSQSLCTFTVRHYERRTG